MMKNKRGISPIISTVLLVMIVILLATIIIVWSKGFIKEIILKEVGGEGEKEIKQVCSEISASPVINDDGSFGITNNGNVPIYALNLKITSTTGSSEIIKINREEGGSVDPGYSIIIEKENYNNYKNIEYIGVKIIPVILGKSKSGGFKEYTCPEKDGVIIK